GRVLYIEFSSGDRLEVRLFPRGANLIARHSEKKVSWRPIQTLKEQSEANAEAPIRNLEMIKEQYFLSIQKVTSRQDPEALRQQRMSKIQKAMSKIEQDLSAKSDLSWQRVGEELKLKQDLNLSNELAQFVDSKKSLAWNIENAFKQHKILEQ